MKKFQIAYVRVSTLSQQVERQKLNILEKCPDVVFVEEKHTGRTMDRPQWNKIMASAEGGHISDLWFDEPSRMGRTAQECFLQYKHLFFDLGINIHFIKCSHVSSEVFETALNESISKHKVDSGDKAADKMVNTILKAIEEYMLEMIERQIYMAFKKAEDESEHLSMRVRSGIANAKEKGVKFGRTTGSHFKSKKEWMSMPIILKHYRGFGGYYNTKGIAKLIGVSTVTAKKYIENIKVEQGLLDISRAKYANIREYNMQLEDVDEYIREAEQIWIERFGYEMKKPWKQVA